MIEINDLATFSKTVPCKMTKAAALPLVSLIFVLHIFK